MENLTTNVATPGDLPHLWIGKSNERSRVGIFSFCISTMIICVWSTLHFNIPTRRYTSTHRFFLEIAWALVALLAPEVLLFLAINERVNAGILLKKALKSHPDLAKPWMVTRMYTYICRLATPRANRCKITPKRHFTLAHAFYATMGGFAFYINDDDATFSVEESLFELSTNPNYVVRVPNQRMCIYLVEHFPNIFTNIPEEFISERAKSSSLSKALLIVQVGWFCTNCASRLRQLLPLSLLEVTTAAHAFCTLLTYFVWWSKPLNVMTPTIIKGKKARMMNALLTRDFTQAAKMVEKMVAGDLSTRTEGHKFALAANILKDLLTTEKLRRPLYHDDNPLVPGSFGNGWGREWIIVTISPMLYGLVHLLPWSDNFPTPLEGLLWRASSLVVTCSGLTGYLWGQGGIFGDRVVGIGKIPITYPIAVIHVLASGYLIGESFRQLLFLDHAAYLPSWTDYWPHLS